MASKRTKGLVVVESPAKAKKINSFLGSDYKVLASMGHVRDLPASASEIPLEFKKESWANLGVNVDAGFSPLYVVPPEKRKVISELKAALKDADELILATDEDREGESIGWHLREVLQPRVPVKRMVFSEITKDAILKAIRNPRELDENLVQAQEARRVLDRLYGYRLSPLLWKKIRRGLSAGRVQSVAVRLLVQRELERRAFRSATYWDLKAVLDVEAAPGRAADVSQKSQFAAVLTTLEGRRVATGKDFDEHTGRLKPDADVRLLSEADAVALQTHIQSVPWRVSDLEERQQTRRPAPPFTTSTLQQEANRKLGMSSRETMAIAQSLYEDGYITYMRTDSVSLSREAVSAARDCVTHRYGREYLHDEVRQYVTKAKGAQEAHEAIRPAGTEMQTAEEIGLTGRHSQLYALIWKRTVATQMAEARLRFITATISAADAEFRATGRTVEFPGFFRAYVEGSDDPEAALDDQDAALPPLSRDQILTLRDLQPLSHETQPPARFTEATLIRTLEADGIGRPSTYASIISTIQDRGYVVKANNQLRPTFTAMAVNKLLEQYFPHLVDEAFTARMEQQLDDIAAGEAASEPYLAAFYRGEAGLDERVRVQEEQIDPREACTLILDGLSTRVRVGKFGPYLEQQEGEESLKASLPDDMPPADLSDEIVQKLLHEKKVGPKSVGTDPESGLPIYVLRGPFGPYLQKGEQVGDEKPKRVSIPKNLNPDELDLETALALLSLPRRLGEHPETGKVVNAGIGRFGPYVLHDKVYKSLGKDQDILTIGLDEAVELLKQARGRGATPPLVNLGKHPDDGEDVGIYEGRYGNYVKHGKLNATLPRERAINEVTLEEAIALLNERASKAGGRKAVGKKSSAARKTATRKAARSSNGVEPGAEAAETAAPKKVAKKTAPGKTASRKAAPRKAAPGKVALRKTAPGKAESSKTEPTKTAAKKSADGTQES